MDLEPHRPATLPAATGPIVVLVGIAIHVLLTEWFTHQGATLLRRPWITTVLSDLGTAAIVLGCVLIGLQLVRRSDSSNRD